ncbi:uncharacterized protein BO88DRAFT_24857 [Aspergillus vadensis CBS 113365]|uniref:Uncharacterized protein n=1 Tax=Aspergillus vadensis (strain CBS 113365 / IMI 142717 / IBT 24658) TaxID=1448311 RepID=A0A319D490_ASPVC|nr:hypothetical protein BO88DRAFT_24857 [Aspergillus vadensis CBS 113365]PYH74882.1 hypothetical protein BO88DRAFT_24857 [Aspergillus vadensis CBS 113365]
MGPGPCICGPSPGIYFLSFTSPLSFLAVSFNTEFCWRCVYGWRRGMHGTRRRIQMASHLASYLLIQRQTTSVSVELNPVNCRQTNSSQVRSATGCFRWVGQAAMEGQIGRHSDGGPLNRTRRGMTQPAQRRVLRNGWIKRRGSDGRRGDTLIRPSQTWISRVRTCPR